MHKYERKVVSTSRESRTAIAAFKILPRVIGQTVTIPGISDLGVSFEDVHQVEWHIGAGAVKDVFPAIPAKPVARKSLREI